jgi:hypothetical protein
LNRVPELRGFADPVRAPPISLSRSFIISGKVRAVSHLLSLKNLAACPYAALRPTWSLRKGESERFVRIRLCWDKCGK